MIKYEIQCALVLFVAIIFKSGNGLKWKPIPEVTHEDSSTSNRLRFIDPKSTESKGGVCDGYDGIMQIKSGDHGAGAGTSFFFYVINQILFAEQNNLIPWAHFDFISTPIYERGIHDVAPTTIEGKPVTFKALTGTKVTSILGTGELSCLGNGAYPGPIAYEDSSLEKKLAYLDVSGVWEYYFEPLSAFQPEKMKAADIASCETKAFVELSQDHLYPHMHICAPWAVRGWHYIGTPQALGPAVGEPNAEYNWLGNMRERAHRIVHQYYRPKPWLIKRVNEVNPFVDGEPPCLALHIRHTDKKDGRRHVPVTEFLPYAKIFVENGGKKIFLATDQAQNIERIKELWPEEVSSRVIRQEDAFLSDTFTPVFYATNPHRANTEALTDVYAMSRCDLIVHGYSAMSEASTYINLNLHQNSVNLESPEPMSQEEFAERVREVVSRSI